MKPKVLQVIVVLLFLCAAWRAGAGNLTVTTAVLPRIAGTSTGGGPYATGDSVTVQAVPTNDCYQFVKWTVGGVEVSTENPYTFTAKRTEALVAVFSQDRYTISTSSFPPKWGTTLGGGKKGCGTMAAVVAHAKPGFAFAGWTLNGSPVSSSNPYKFAVSENESLVANFRDIAPPRVKILSPVKNQAIANPAFPIQGTASDNVGVAAVYYNLNGEGWVKASNWTNYTSWYAWVSLTPNASNSVLVYAMDTSGNTNPAVAVRFDCTAAGYAPLSISGHQAAVSNSNDHCTSSIMSFDLASYVRVNACTNDQGQTGTYTYTPTGPNTAELVPQRFLPKQELGLADSPMELTFTDAFNATFTDGNGGSGYFSFVLAADTAPTTLDAATIVATSFIYSNSYNKYVWTNDFGSSTFTFGDSGGARESGTYSMTKFTDVGALVAETVTSPPGVMSNYLVLTFVEGTSPLVGFYDYASVTGASEFLDAGTFVLTRGADSTAFLGPASLYRWRATVTPTGQPPFTRFYGNGTYASLSLLSTNGPTDVGIALANTRVTGNRGMIQFFALAPPFIAGSDDETVDLTFTSASTASFAVEGDSSFTGSSTFSRVGATAPAALSGHTISAVAAGGSPTTVATFSYNNFTTTGGVAGNGTYTYAPYAPSVALVTQNVTGGTDAGESTYLMLDFTTPEGGTFGYAQPDPANPGQWVFTKGQFTFKP